MERGTNSQKHMHCFAAAFEYGGEQYRATYTAKENRNNGGTYLPRLYLQITTVIKAQKNAAGIEGSLTRTSSEQTRITYIYPTADIRITYITYNVKAAITRIFPERYHPDAMK